MTLAPQPTATPAIIVATVPSGQPPAWAFQQRALFKAMDSAIEPFLEKYINADGSLKWTYPDTTVLASRDGGDDFYEAFYNWPLLYLLGGSDRLLPLAHRHWEAVTEQLTGFGLVENEFDIGYDQFHISEGSLFLYFLALADPGHPDLVRRVQKFAGLYLGDDPEIPNYDPYRRMIRAPHNGSRGPRDGLFDGDHSYAWAASMQIYGLPLHDVPGVETFDDLRDPALARRMGEAMYQRMSRGDVPANLAVTSLVTLAYLLTGEPRYRDWVDTYVGVWKGLADGNDGILPDNVGLSGEVGEYHGGAWYGGHYGWTWPHGFYNIGAAASVAAANATLATGNASFLDLARNQFDAIMAHGRMERPNPLAMSLHHHWLGALSGVKDGDSTWVIPYRHGPDGWFDYQPPSAAYALAIWTISGDPADWSRIEQLRERSGYDWGRIVGFHNKEDAGHEEPWTRFLAGAFPGYPEHILAASYAQILRRSDLIREDAADLTEVHIHHWQQLNPVTTEALVHLTLGVPQPLYYGGLLHARVRYFDAERRRPGLPEDVAALVTGADLARTTIHLVNLSPVERRRVLVQAGAFGEHRFATITWDTRTSDYPGEQRSYAAPALQTTHEHLDIDGNVVEVDLPPGSEIRLTAQMDRYAYQPTATVPWKRQADSGL